jgi:hypothetical protein
MGQINWGRVIGGGLMAGVVMNVSQFLLHAVVLREDGRMLMDQWNRMGFHVTEDPKLLSMLIALTFLLGVLAVWTYAAIRPRFGPGPKTAIIAGLAVWAMSYLYAAVYVYAGIVIYPEKLTWMPVAWSLIEVPIATMVGGWFYRE